MDIEERVKYYMGKWYDTKFILENSNVYEIGDGRLHDRIILLNSEKLKTIERIRNYSKYLVDNADLFQNKEFLYSMGDQIHNKELLPVICKTTSLLHPHIITKLNHSRHWENVLSVNANDIPYTQKKNSIVWRGTTTGFSKRNPVVEKYHNHPIFNIGFNRLLHGNLTKNPAKGDLSIKEQLEYKFILSIEGNDVASGLKWQLYSNSVVIMAKPTCISWAMEDRLKPYFHYIPVKDDYSNLVEVFNWALRNEAACRAISKNAKAFIKQFLDEAKEKEIHRRIIKRYINNIQIKPKVIT